MSSYGPSRATELPTPVPLSLRAAQSFSAIGTAWPKADDEPAHPDHSVISVVE